MASSKRIGFYWGENKITLVGFEKNAPLRVATSSLDLKNTSSPFGSNLNEEFQTMTVFQELLEQNQFSAGPFYVSLPMKEIILRSFTIPSVKPDEMQGAIKFEAKKYLPIDIQDLSFVFHTIPFTENKVRRLQVIFFAVRKETLLRYDRIFKKINAGISYCEPCVVSLAKVLLFKKEITANDHLAFFSMDKNSGRICFIKSGVPQFVRDFSISIPEEAAASSQALNLKIVNEVANSFDFYARQFNVEHIEQLLVSSEAVSEELLGALEAELKLKLRKVSPIVTMGERGQNNDTDVIYAMGACVDPSIDAVSGFNFLGDSTSKYRLQFDLTKILTTYRDSVLIFLVCAAVLFGAQTFFQGKLKLIQQQYDQISSKEGPYYSNVPVETIQADLQQSTDSLQAYKNVRAKSDIALVVLKVASHLPKGAMLDKLSVQYPQENSAYVVIEMNGHVVGDPDKQIASVNQIYFDLKNDKVLLQFVKSVRLLSMVSQNIGDKKSTVFQIQCS
jgi:Tfp pilus assembly PilM family ATPase